MKRFGKVLAAMAGVVALIGIGSSASADHVGDGTELDHSGQGTGPDGECSDVRFNPEVPAGSQLWQFNLTNLGGGAAQARIDAEFDDNTSVTDLAPGLNGGGNGNLAHFFVHTEIGANLVSATAHFDGAAAENPQFTVSHCNAGEEIDNGEDNGDDENGDEEEEEEVVEEEVEVEVDVEAAPPVKVQPVFTG
jgi:hypothetical protein